ncbi:MAG: cytochrome c3 family protein [Deferrisomatales bacterium]|nr:cytochrome c3 family protein [Deferrisomatales bacterium]
MTLAQTAITTKEGSVRYLTFCLLTIGVVGFAPAWSWGSSFKVPNSDCLVDVCHGSLAPREGLWISKRFDFDSTPLTDPAQTNNDNILSQHNIEYTQDGDFDTIEAVNECKTCHIPEPTDPDSHRYVSTGTILRYPDAFGGNSVGSGISRASDFSAYQSFCLSCHDGVTAGGIDRLGATTYAMAFPNTQVEPSDRDNPELPQSGPPWLVPEVAPDPTGNPASYFDGYEVDGHGATTSPIEAWPMNKTCLAQTATPDTVSSSTNVLTGCHTVHGSENRFLMADYDKAATPNLLFGPGIDQMGEVALNFCLRADGCHSSGALADAVTNEPWQGAARVQNEFHGSWLKNLSNTGPGHTRGGSGMAPWREYDRVRLENEAAPTPVVFGVPNAEVLNAQILANAAVDSGLLPFYADPSGSNPVENRDYAPTLGPRWYSANGIWSPSPPVSPNWISCLTCHDPHGTNSLLGEGMLRVDFVDMEISSDPLCGECHL